MSASIAKIVFARTGRVPKRHWGLAAMFAIALHGGLYTLAMNAQPTLEFWASDLATHVHAELGRTQDVTVAPPPPPPQAPPPKPPPPPPTPATPAVAQGPRAPAEAGQVIAQEADEAADLTGMTFVTGTAKAYAGGKTTASGKSKTFVSADTKTAPKGKAEPTYAQPLALADTDWTCPWPREADVAEVDRESAVVRVTVSVEGRALAVNIVQDPGFGFGSAAADCARRARYLAARDAAGKPVEATSPIRVRFER